MARYGLSVDSKLATFINITVQKVRPPNILENFQIIVDIIALTTSYHYIEDPSKTESYPHTGP